MRMSRFDWLDMHARNSTRPQAKRKPATGRKIIKWRAGITASLCSHHQLKKFSKGLYFFAFTKSEARAMLKKEMGWTRVPVGVAITKVRS